MEPSDTQRDLAMEGKQKLGNAIITAAERIEDAYERLARVERQLNLGTTAAPSNVGDNQILAEFDSIVSEKLAGVFEAAISIGGRVELLVQLRCRYRCFVSLFLPFFLFSGRLTLPGRPSWLSHQCHSSSHCTFVPMQKT